MKRFSSALVAGIWLLAGTLNAAAHHGWSWTTDGDFVLEGVIREIYLGSTVTEDGSRAS